MKTLTIRQPFASGIAWGEKTIEHRSWATPHRGPLLIHAGAAPYRLKLDDGETMQLPYGCIIARVNLVEVRPFTPDDCDAACMESPLPGYAWVMEAVQEVRPVRAKGRLHLWEWEGPLDDLPKGGICHVEAWHEARAGVVELPA